MRYAMACAIGVAVCTGSAWGLEPAQLWAFKATANLYGPPVVADATPVPGLECIISDSDGRTLRCVDSTGREVWAFRGAWKKRLTASPAFSANARGEGGTVACGGSEGLLYCLDAATGSELWHNDTGALTWGGVLWADLDGDGRDELVAGTDSRGVQVFIPNGTLLWQYPADEPAALALEGPLAACDLDGDGALEIIGAAKPGPFCLNEDGTLRWQSARPEGEFIGGAVVADANGDGRLEVYCCDRAADELAGFDARDGALMWRVPLLGKTDVYPASAIAVADVDYDARLEIVVGDNQGHLHCFDDAGTLKWTYATVAPVHIAATIGDVDGDGAVEILAASGDHRLYCLDGRGALKWAYETGLRIVSPPTLADMDGNGATDILLGASDGFLRCLTCNGAYNAGRMPWPSRRYDAAQSGACPNSDSARHIADGRPAVMRALVNQAGYDTGAPKRFVVQTNIETDSATFALIDSAGNEVFTKALEPAGGITGAYGNDWGCQYWRGDFSGFNAKGTFRIRVELAGLTDLSWPFEIGENLLWERTARPAYRFFYYQRCGMAVPGFHEACHLDDAAGVDGTQYSLAGGWHDAGDYNKYHNAPYVFALARAYDMRKAAFDAQDANGDDVSDMLEEALWGGDHARRMVSPDGSAFGGITSGYGFWGPPEMETDNIPATGDERPFDQAPDAGRDPHAHLVALTRLARFTEDNADLLEAAARAFAWREAKGSRDLWQLLAALDLYALTRDQRYARTAREALEATGPNALAGMSPHAPEFVYLCEGIERFDATFAEDHREVLREVLAAKAGELLANAWNPFGVATHGPSDRPNFFGTPAEPADWYVGTSSFILNAAASMATAWRYTGDPRHLAYVYDQINWTLGTNPYDLCLMEGAGSFHPPSYHHRYVFAGVSRGAVPGSIVNGITFKAPRDDRPHFDMTGVDIPEFHSNECWLPHNTAYLGALVELTRE